MNKKSSKPVQVDSGHTLPTFAALFNAGRGSSGFVLESANGGHDAFQDWVNHSFKKPHASPRSVIKDIQAANQPSAKSLQTHATQAFGSALRFANMRLAKVSH